MPTNLGKIVISWLFVLAAGCTNVFDPSAVQQDESLFDRAMQLLRKSRYQESRTLLETLIVTYPESAYAPRAELALDDIRRAEGGTPRREAAPPGGGVTFFPSLEERKDDKK
jgi:outer membrane protein assembly factor BamD (BamD/ComL family)